MQVQNSFQTEQGILYLVATPIGNLGDITLRALETLKSVDLVYAEDTRITYNLLKHFNIDTKILNYHEFNKEVQGPKIIEQLKQGLNIALVSDAGTPIISDPGYHVVDLAVQNNFSVVPIPGANAAISALIVSNITPKPFTFYGFLDSKPSKRDKELTMLKDLKQTLIFYEAPHRITKTLEAMLKIFGDRKIALAREITKRYESVIRGNISEVLKISDNLKGEMVIVVEENKQVVVTTTTVIEDVLALIKTGLHPKDAISEVSSMRNVAKKVVYQEYLNWKDNNEL